jgi:cell division protein FtsL
VTISPAARVGLLGLVFAALGALGLLRVSRHRAVVQLGYELGDAMAELRRLEEEERRLELEEAVLTAPARIEKLAGELGMVRPPPAAIRVVGPPRLVRTP